MRIIFLLLLACLVGAFPAYGKTPVTFAIESAEYALVLQSDSENRLRYVYFGKKLKTAEGYKKIGSQLRYDSSNEDQFNMVYTPAGTWNVSSCALDVVHADGNLSTELVYKEHRTEKVEANIAHTIIGLMDPFYKTEVEVHFKVYEKENVFEQWSVIKNNEEGSIRLKKYASANLYFRNQDFYLTQFSSSWASEMMPETHQLTSGIKVLDSKLGTRANLYAPPTFMLSFDEEATEDSGRVMLANLAWSGNFRFDFEVDRYKNLRLIAGVNDFSSERMLEAGEVFETPRLLYAYSENGKGEASRNFHAWARRYQLRDGEGDRLSLLNNWEATYFNFDEKKLGSLIEGAKELGVDVFLLDDGWFGNKYPRDSDKAGLGDWQENVEKLPSGLSYLVEKAEENGVKFGIWIEPEMVNPKSELYENHKDWVIRQLNRKEIYYRNQLVLDLSNPDVQDHVYGVFDKLFTDNPDIGYVKWDCNAVIYNAYSNYLAKQGLPQTHLYVDYVKGLYGVLERIRKKYPKVPIMLCAGGGGRVDYGALKYFTEFWPSDNTSPIDRVFMHWNYSYFYPAIAMCAHVTEWDRKSSLKFRTDVASMGKLGFDIEVDKLSKDELLFCQQAIKNYNDFKVVVQLGDQYRLRDPYKNTSGCFQFVTPQKDKSVVFSYLVSSRFEDDYFIEPLQMKGLEPETKYRVREVNLFPGKESVIDSSVEYSGDFLMKNGINPRITKRRRSVVLLVEAVE